MVRKRVIYNFVPARGSAWNKRRNRIGVVIFRRFKRRTYSREKTCVNNRMTNKKKTMARACGTMVLPPDQPLTHVHDEGGVSGMYRRYWVTGSHGDYSGRTLIRLGSAVTLSFFISFAVTLQESSVSDRRFRSAFR